MKKILVLALAIVMALSVVALVACDKEATYDGEYKYENPYKKGQNDYYGVQVKVTVKGDVIMKVEITSENKEGYTNLSSGWSDKAKWTEGEKAFLDSFTGLKVEDVKKIEVVKDANGAPDTKADDTIKNAPSSLKIVETADHTGATQSSGRVILAVQNALSKIAK